MVEGADEQERGIGRPWNYFDSWAGTGSLKRKNQTKSRKRICHGSETLRSAERSHRKSQSWLQKAQLPGLRSGGRDATCMGTCSLSSGSLKRWHAKMGPRGQCASSDGHYCAPFLLFLRFQTPTVKYLLNSRTPCSPWRLKTLQNVSRDDCGKIVRLYCVDCLRGCDQEDRQTCQDASSPELATNYEDEACATLSTTHPEKNSKENLAPPPPSPLSASNLGCSFP